MCDWVHCNKCSLKYNPQTTFFLVECGNIFCQRCVEKIKITKKCPICNKSGNVLALNKDVDQNVLDFFSPVEPIMKKALEIYKFQMQHRISEKQMLLDKYNYAKKEYLTLYNTHKHVLKENQLLRSMLRSAGKSPQGFTTSTPVSISSDNNNLTFQNTSMVSSIPGMAPKDYGAPTRFLPGHPRRNLQLSSGSSQGPSPAQRVPIGYSKLQDAPMVHRQIGTMRSLEDLRRGKSQPNPPNNRN